MTKTLWNLQFGCDFLILSYLRWFETHLNIYFDLFCYFDVCSSKINQFPVIVFTMFSLTWQRHLEICRFAVIFLCSHTQDPFKPIKFIFSYVLLCWLCAVLKNKSIFSHYFHYIPSGNINISEICGFKAMWFFIHTYLRSFKTHFNIHISSWINKLMCVVLK